MSESQLPPDQTHVEVSEGQAQIDSVDQPLQQSQETSSKNAKKNKKKRDRKKQKQLEANAAVPTQTLESIESSSTTLQEGNDYTNSAEPIVEQKIVPEVPVELSQELNLPTVQAKSTPLDGLIDNVVESEPVPEPDHVTEEPVVELSENIVTAKELNVPVIEEQPVQEILESSQEVSDIALEHLVIEDQVPDETTTFASNSDTPLPWETSEDHTIPDESKSTLPIEPETAEVSEVSEVAGVLEVPHEEPEVPETSESTEPYVVDPASELFGSAEETDLPWGQSEVAEKPVSVQLNNSESDLLEEEQSDLFAASKESNLPWESQPIESQQEVNPEEQTDLFGSSEQADLPWIENQTPVEEQPRPQMDIVEALMFQNSRAATEATELAFEEGENGETINLEDHLVEEATEEKSNIEDSNHVESQEVQDDLFGHEQRSESLPWEEPQVNSVIHNEPTQVMDNGDAAAESLFESKNDFDFSASLKQTDSTGTNEGTKKEDKFAFLSDNFDDDLLDDDLLDDDLLDDITSNPVQAQPVQPVEQFQKIQPTQQSRYAPAQPANPGYGAVPSQRNPYNSYNAPPVTSQPHLNIDKLNASKKKSDAYDFPVDLMPKREFSKPAVSHVYKPQEPQVQQVPQAPAQPIAPPQFPQNVNNSVPPTPAFNKYGPTKSGPPISTGPPSASKFPTSPKAVKKQSSFFEELPGLQHIGPAKPAKAAQTVRSVSNASVNTPQANLSPSFGRAPNSYERKLSATGPPAAPNSRYSSVSNTTPSTFPPQPPMNKFAPVQQQQQPQQQLGYGVGAHPSGTSPTANHYAPGPPGINKPNGLGLQSAAPVNGYPVNQQNAYPPQPPANIYQPQPPSQINVYGQQPTQPNVLPANNIAANQAVPQPALSPLLNQVQGGQYLPNAQPAQTLGVNTNLNVINSLKSPNQPTQSSASRYAPINHKRQASNTANHYDPNSLSKVQGAGGPPPKFQPNLPGLPAQPLQPQTLNQPPFNQQPVGQNQFPPQAGFNQQPIGYQNPSLSQPPIGYQQQVPAIPYGVNVAQQAAPNPEQLLKRQFPLFNWGSGKKVAYYIPSNGYQSQSGIKVIDTEQVLKEQSLKEFPVISKKNLTAIVKYLDHLTEQISNKRNSLSDDDEILLIQLLKHKLTKNPDLFNYGAHFNYTEQGATHGFQDKSRVPKQPLNKRHLFALISAGQKVEAVELALQYDNFALALFISGIIDKPTWLRTVENYLKHEFSGDDNHFLPTLLHILVGEVNTVISSFRNDPHKKQFALTHWRELLSSVVANKPESLNLFLSEYAGFLSDNGRVLAAHVVSFSGDLPLPPKLLSSSLKVILYSEIYGLILQEAGQQVDMTEVYVHHSSFCIDYNLPSEAQRYLDLASASLKTSKAIDNRLKIAVRSLSEQVSGPADGGWFGRPKLDKVWGQLDKSLNKFISGDEAKPKLKEGVFSKFSPSVSRTSSFVSISNAVPPTGYDPNSSFTSIPSGAPRHGSLNPPAHHLASAGNPPLATYSSRPQVNRSYTPQTDINVTQHSSPAGPNYYAPPPAFGRSEYTSPKGSKTGVLSPKQRPVRYSIGHPDSRRSSIGDDVKAPAIHPVYNPTGLSQVVESPLQPPQHPRLASPPSNNALNGNNGGSSAKSPAALPPPPLNTSRSASRSRSRTRYAPIASLEPVSDGNVLQTAPAQPPLQRPALQTEITQAQSVHHSQTYTAQPPIDHHQEEINNIEGELPTEDFERLETDEIIAESSVVHNVPDENIVANTHSITHNESVSDFGSSEVVPYEEPTTYENGTEVKAEDTEYQEELEKEEPQDQDFAEPPHSSEEFDIPKNLQNEVYQSSSQVIEDQEDPEEQEELEKIQNDESNEPEAVSIEPIISPSNYTPDSQPEVSQPTIPVEQPQKSVFTPKANPYAPVSSDSSLPVRSNPFAPPSEKKVNPYAPRSGKKANPYAPVSVPVSLPEFTESNAKPHPSGEPFNPAYPPSNYTPVAFPESNEPASSSQNNASQVQAEPLASLQTNLPPTVQRKSSTPVNPYAPIGTPVANRNSRTGFSTPGQSRKSSYAPVSDNGNEGNFSSYRSQSIGDSDTVVSAFNAPGGPRVTTPTTSMFDPLQPPTINRSASGSPSTKFNAYEPPTTHHNITKIGEEDEEYYDDIVDDDDDDDDDEEEKKSSKKTETKKKEDKDAKKTVKSKESGTGWFDWLRKENNGPKVYKAHMGQQNSFYYNENLKRWVNKNASPEELKAVSAPTPPPPIIKKKPSNLSKPRSDTLTDSSAPPSINGNGLPNAPPASSGPPSTGPAPSANPSSVPSPSPGPSGPKVPSKVSSDLDSLLGLSAPSAGASARRKKRGGRGYVDVMGSIQDK